VGFLFILHSRRLYAVHKILFNSENLAHTAKVVGGRWYLLTVLGSGSDPSIPVINSMSKVGNTNPVVALAEPFPWTVSQGLSWY
jgi:hypothetical protein